MTRAALVVLALVVGTWLALGLRDAQRLDEAAALLAGGDDPVRKARVVQVVVARTVPDPALARRVRRLLDDRPPLLPGARADLLGALAVAVGGDRDRAADLALAVAREHPEDVEAWTATAFLATVFDPRGAEAFRRLERLVGPPR